MCPEWKAPRSTSLLLACNAGPFPATGFWCSHLSAEKVIRFASTFCHAAWTMGSLTFSITLFSCSGSKSTRFWPTPFFVAAVCVCSPAVAWPASAFGLLLKTVLSGMLFLCPVIFRASGEACDFSRWSSLCRRLRCLLCGTCKCRVLGPIFVFCFCFCLFWKSRQGRIFERERKSSQE